MFFTYFVGNLLSNCGTWIQNIAQSILVYRLTHSSLLVGVTNFSQFAGVTVLAPWSGRAADRFDRRRLIVLTQLVAVAITGILAALAGLGRASVPVVIGLALLLGANNAFVEPALKAFVPSLVAWRDVGAALTMDSATFSLARAVGPVAGAAIVALVGIPWAFAVNCTSYLTLIAALLVIGPRPQARRAGSPARLRDSLRLVRNDTRLAVLLGVTAAVSMACDPPNTLGPAFSTHVFHHSASLTGVLVGGFGAGATLAALTATAERRNPERWIAVTLVAMLVGVVGFATAGSLPVALVALVIAGFGFLAVQTSATTLIVVRVPDGQRGQVMALWTVAFLGTRPLASLTEGLLSGPLGIRGAAGFMAVPLLVALAALALVRRIPPGPA